ncbi:glutathione S-transferase family protein [Desulfurispirillum indicum]|uniref:Glutathione transferase n=1 Tax=Desulfurispirillum indicum (strain ATCC BAA-1389 / DSM 22839 / S5) TaxID=653733 RepID=E6W7B0_DESIS|nr:glutathione S-transferase family protein [Desulfurispirillum indicum]ADU66277.1 Glutathione transferase [Desulfurispirillum indicum S5]UCZ55608.1 glutathione S-transferase family protein [Desulfurispirillum indicum]
MGLLVDGKWHDKWYDTAKHGGRFVREDARFRNWITADGSAGPGGSAGFTAEADRYHLYVSLACPWAHRTLIFRALKGLQELIPVSVVHPHMLASGWEFAPDPEPLHGSRFLHELYTRADDTYTGRVTVPVLWDKKQQTIVSNESAEIIRMFNGAFDHLTANTEDFCPIGLLPEIDRINEFVYHRVNNGVYRCGFATTQDAYEEAFHELFGALDELELLLGKSRYLVGDRLTEADWRLFTTLVRFDAVYFCHFKTNQRMISSYAHLQGYLKELYQYPGVRETVNFEHIKQHYFFSHGHMNPARIVPLGPVLDLDSPHGRHI